MAMNQRTLRPSASGFTPRSITGLALWLDASDASTLFQDAAATTPATATSDPVGAWLDKSGNARHATQSTAGNRPTVSAASLNSRGTVAFAGALSQRLGATVPGTDGQLYTLLAVVRNATSANGVLMGERGGNFTNALHFQTANNRLTMYIQRSEPLYGPHSGAAVIYGYSKDSTSLFRGYQNGARVISDDGAVVSGLHLANLLRNIGSSTGGASAFTGNIAELIAYPTSLSDANRQRVERYLAAKWGITLAPQVSNADAQDWINRVYANGGTVSSSTAAAVNTFCDAIDAASIRDRFYRLNLFCGGTSGTAVGLNSCLVPLYRGPSLGGTQYGGTIDINTGPFLPADYNETVAPGGLKGNGSKWLDTGLAGTALSVGNRHCAAFWTEANTLTGNRAYIGNSDATSSKAWFDIHSTAPSVAVQSQFTDSASVTHPSGGRFAVAQYVGETSAESYADGGDKRTITSFPSGAPTVSSANWTVFGINPSLFSGVRVNGRIAFYSIGLAIPENKQAPLHNAVQGFQTALSRSV